MIDRNLGKWDGAKISSVLFLFGGENGKAG
jgi:hypothetical protein